MKKNIILLLLALFLFSFGCKENIEGKVKKKAGDYKWNKDEAEVAFVIANRRLMAEEMKDKKGAFKVNARRIKIKDVLKKTDEIIESVDAVLGTSDERWRNYLEVNGLRSEFERERKKHKIVRDRLQLVYLNSRFYELLGLSRNIDDYNGSMSGAPYSLKYLLSDEEVLKYDFVAKMDELKAKGKFREFQTVVYFITDEMAQKMKDPNYPDDSNRFVWKKIRRGLEIKTYLASGENPLGGEAEYIEATRIEIAMSDKGETIKRESKPVLRIFSSGYRKLSVAVVDADFEGDYGFGMPDEIFELSGIKNGAAVLKDEKLVAYLFGQKEKNEMPKYVKKEQNIEIVKAGERPIDEWETSDEPNGWQVGFRYKDQMSQNYKIKVIYKTNGSAASANPHSGKREIEAIAKEYYIPGEPNKPSVGAVVEYYRPISPYDKNDILDAEAKGKKLTIYREGESAVTGIIQNKNNIFIQDKPFRVDYTEGEQRWRLEDRKENDGVFESKKKISVSKHENGNGKNKEEDENGEHGEHIPY